MDPKSVLCCDVSTIDLDALQPIDGLVFGFPCNDFSIVGERKGISGHFGGLYQWGVRALKAKRPLFFVAENVGGLATSGNALDVITGALKGSGYTVFKKMYRFEDYGVPQSRHRIIFVGFRTDLRVRDFEHPDPTTRGNPITSRSALAGIPEGVANNELTSQSRRVVERLKHIRPGENVFTAKLPKRLQLRMKSNATISQIYRRLDPDKPSYTVTGSGGGGALTSTIGSKTVR